MTKALEAAFQAASSLPEGEQESLALAILADVGFDSAIASRPDLLGRLADEALAEHQLLKNL